MIAIWKKELQSYFFSPIAYVFMGIFILLTGVFATIGNFLPMNADFVTTLNSMLFIFILLIPILTMRLLSEERRTKTDQLLITAPIRVSDIVLGKYFAAMTVLLITLVISFIYPITMASFGTISVMEIAVCYFGFFLVGTALISIGMFMSSITENQVTAAISTFGVLLVLWLSDPLSQSISITWLLRIIQWLAINQRISDLMKGIISPGPIVYSISIAAIFVFLTVRSVEKRRWSEG